MRTSESFIVVVAGLMMLDLMLTPALAQNAGSPKGIKSPEKEYSPYLSHNYPDKVL